jgi:hypothetical protein
LDSYKGVTREAVEKHLGCALEWDRALLQTTVSGGERVKNALHVAMPTAQKLRDHWRDLTATRFYCDSVPDIVDTQRRIFGLGAASNDG